MEKEKDDGNVEYKSQLINLNENRIQQLMTQMAYRLVEGKGEAIYEIGVRDDGTLIGLPDNEFNESLDNLKKIVENINASIIHTCIKKVEKNSNLKIAEITIRENNTSGNYIDIYVSVIGNVDSGKSSLIGVLSKNILDDGRGKARSSIVQFKHELITGRTSTVTHHLMGFDNNGKCVNERNFHNISWNDITENSNKVITFTDLCGHEKYLRTTIYGVTSVPPDYAMIIVGANSGINHMTKEHMAICLSFKIPFFIVITKIDICPPNILNETMNNVTRLLKLPGVRKIPYIIKNYDEIPLCSKNIAYNNVVPIIQVSNVTAENLDKLKSFLNLLPYRRNFDRFINDPVEFLIDGIFTVTGVGTVVSGILNSGKVKINDPVLLGPNSIGEFYKTQVRSIHCKRLLVNEAKAGEYVCFSLKKIPKNWVRKGMVIIGENNKQRAVWEFDAEISILKSHHTTIRENYEPFLHINNVRQSTKIKKIEKILYTKDKDKETFDKLALRTGDKARVHFKFVHKPEYLKKGFQIIFREGKIRGVGTIVDLRN